MGSQGECSHELRVPGEGNLKSQAPHFLRSPSSPRPRWRRPVCLHFVAAVLADNKAEDTDFELRGSPGRPLAPLLALEVKADRLDWVVEGVFQFVVGIELN